MKLKEINHSNLKLIKHDFLDLSQVLYDL